MEDLAKKSVVVVGMGREGVATLSFLRQQFPKKQVAVADRVALKNLPEDVQKIVTADKHLSLHLGDNYLSDLSAFDVIIKSAGVPLKLVEPHKGSAIITSPTQLFFDNCVGTIIGVTGTKGKSTTTSVIYEVLKAQSNDVVLCGNIGKAALDFLPQIHKSALVVMELSSHQLQTLTKSPHIAVLQNIVPEHLDYYNSFQEYVVAKENITRFQTEADLLLYNADYPIPYEIAQRSKAKRIPFNAELGNNCCFVQNGQIIYKRNGQNESIMNVNKAGLTGNFNVQNVLPAVVIGKIFNVPNEIIARAVHAFKGLEDRLEYVGTVGGAGYYNDTLATVPEATIAAIEAFEPSVATLIAGGFDRGLDFSSLAKKIIASGITTLILFPTTGQKIWQSVADELEKSQKSVKIDHYFVDTMQDAVKLAKTNTPPGKVCLLSPASPSFGIFKDYHDRGSQFKALLRSE